MRTLKTIIRLLVVAGILGTSSLEASISIERRDPQEPAIHLPAVSFTQTYQPLFNTHRSALKIRTFWDRKLEFESGRLSLSEYATFLSDHIDQNKFPSNFTCFIEAAKL